MKWSLLLLTVATVGSDVTAQNATISRALYDQWFAAVSNAGRWGDQDELGTLNLITADKRRRASQSVRDGISVSLAHDLVGGANPNAIQPLQFRFIVSPADSVITWTLDEITLMAHGWAYSHLDALAHSMYRGRMYNGFGRDQLPESGAQKLGINAMRDGIVSRGVIVDLPRLRTSRRGNVTAECAWNLVTWFSFAPAVRRALPPPAITESRAAPLGRIHRSHSG
jgi:hypothetical protein